MIRALVVIPVNWTNGTASFILVKQFNCDDFFFPSHAINEGVNIKYKIYELAEQIGVDLLEHVKYLGSVQQHARKNFEVWTFQWKSVKNNNLKIKWFEFYKTLSWLELKKYLSKDHEVIRSLIPSWFMISPNCFVNSL